LVRGIAAARRPGQELVGLLPKHRDAATFDHWLALLRVRAVPELRRFAAGLMINHDAVHAAVVMPCSSGQLERKINPPKLLKRQMHAPCTGQVRLASDPCTASELSDPPPSREIGISRKWNP
jgi:hypothetical protein